MDQKKFRKNVKTFVITYISFLLLTALIASLKLCHVVEVSWLLVFGPLLGAHIVDAIGSIICAIKYLKNTKCQE